MSAVDKTLKVLDLFLNTKDELGITDVARATGMNPATAYRIISALVRNGYLERQNREKKYSISGKKIIVFSRIVMTRLMIRNVALPFMHELSKQVNESTQLAICLGNVAFNLNTVYTDQMLHVRPATENTIDLYSTGVGKVFLSYMPEPEFQEYCESTVFEARTPSTITGVNELKRELKKIKKAGVSFDYEEHELGIVGIAAPVEDPSGKIVAALGVIAPRVRVNRRKMSEIGKVVKDYAARISGALKHYQNYPTFYGFYVTESTERSRTA